MTSNLNHMRLLSAESIFLLGLVPVVRPSCGHRCPAALGEKAVSCGLDSNQVAGDETGSKSAVRFTPRSALRYRSRAAEQLRCRVFVSCFDFD